MRRAAIVLAAVLAGMGYATPAPASERTLAIIGDTPYGDEQEAAFPRLVADVNDDPRVRRVVHLGDIKNGSSTCDDARLLRLRDLFGTFEDPFLYTPGDNEWTDCHRPAAGGYVPTERLARLRRLFYPEREVPVATQRAPFVENQRWSDGDVVWALVHVVGSDNGRAPWFGGAETPAQRAERLAEVEAREAAALEWIDRAFERAERERARGVVIGMQADTFAGSTAFERINDRLEHRARRFRRPVLLLQGDTHVYKTDRPLERAPNLTRVVVEGETASEWLRLTVDPRSRHVFSWRRVQLPPAVTVATYNIAHAAGIDGRLGIEVVYGANLDLDPAAPDRPRRQYGTAILSVHPIAWSRNTHLPRPENGEQRGLLEARGRAARADGADRRAPAPLAAADRVGRRPQRAARRARAGAALDAARGRLAARRHGRRLLLSLLRAGPPDRLRPHHPRRRRRVGAHPPLPRLRSPAGRSRPRAAAGEAGAHAPLRPAGHRGGLGLVTESTP